MNKSNAGFLLSWILVFLFPFPVFAVSADYPVISEVQIGGDFVTKEFVELYNPTADAIDLTNWKLTKKTVTGNESNLVTNFPASAISGFGYLLISHTDFNAVPPDIYYSTSNSLAADNTVSLYDNSGILVDKLGMGTASDKEGIAFANPPANQSLERKAGESSSLESMTTGEDNLSGNGFDSNDNSFDFILRALSEPQNSASSTEIPVDRRPTSTPIPTLTPTQTLTPTPTLTLTLTPVPTEIPLPTIMPTITTTPIPTPTIKIIEFPIMQTMCFLKHYPYRLFFHTIYLPRVYCVLKSN